MAATKTAAAVTDGVDAARVFSAEGCTTPRVWANDPGYEYGHHSHDYHKVLFCLQGSITFHVRGGDVQLAAGDRLDIEPGTVHSATVGPQGVRCMEAAR